MKTLRNSNKKPLLRACETVLQEPIRTPPGRAGQPPFCSADGAKWRQSLAAFGL